MPEMKEEFHKHRLSLLLITLTFSLPGLCALALPAPVVRVPGVCAGAGLREAHREGTYCLFFAAPPLSSGAWLAKREHLADT